MSSDSPRSRPQSDVTSRLFSIMLTLQRLVLAGWVGAAILFVVTSVAEQTSPHFDTTTRDLLATIRFPWYYRFGFIAHIVAGTFGFLTWRAAPVVFQRRALVVLVLTMLSALLIALDFQFVYRPLQELILVPGRPRTEQFHQLHTWSKHANEVHVTIMFVAALVLSAPIRCSDGSSETTAD